jgi:hypothetical protein
MGISPMQSQTIFAGTNGSGLFRSVDGAKSWEAVPLKPPVVGTSIPKT